MKNNINNNTSYSLVSSSSLLDPTTALGASAPSAALQDPLTTGLVEYVLEAVNTTATALAGAALEGARQHLSSSGGVTKETDSASGGDVVGGSRSGGGGGDNAPVVSATGGQKGEDEWTGIGLEWLRSLLGQREFTLPCVDVKIRL